MTKPKNNDENIKIDVEWDTSEKCWTGTIVFSDGFVEILASDIDQLIEDIRLAHDEYLDLRGDFNVS